MPSNTFHIGLVGGGPRGLSALESLCACSAKSSLDYVFYVHLFEPLDFPGAGQVYVPDQSSQHWLNVPERLLDIPGRESCVVDACTIPGFPSYWEFAELEPEQWDPECMDRYPTRGELGEYLSERFRTLAQPLISSGMLTWHQSKVVAIESFRDRWQITDSEGVKKRVHELAIAAGHQPTETDEQMVQWKLHANAHEELLCHSKPFSQPLLQSLAGESNRICVACRGFGLTMVDVMKNLTEGLGGSYRADPSRENALSYLASGKEPVQIIPFSLDGLPLSPKPVSLAVDQHYTPSEPALEKLAQTLSQALELSSAQFSRSDIISAMAALAVPVFQRLGDRARSHQYSESALVKMTEQFLDDPASIVSHPLFDIDLPVSDALEGYLMMAYGARPSSLDYCLGQVWRHAQPVLYKSLSYQLTEHEEIAEIVAMDERMKRYAFGPPPASLERMLALCEANVLSFEYIDDPGISTAEGQGWLFKNESANCTVQVIIDTVLDSTTIIDVSSPLFTQLREQNIIQSVHKNLGVKVNRDATIKPGNDKTSSPPLAVLGRLAQGSLIGVDAIIECFGERQDNWASGVIRRLDSRSKKDY